MNKIKTGLRKWLELMPSQDTAILIQEQSSFESNVIKNRILYRGDPSEIDQYFHQAAKDQVSKARFWASSPSKGLNIRKWHSGLPGMMVNVLADIVVTDMLDVSFTDFKADGDKVAVWEAIAEENNFKKLIDTAVQEVLVTGDGAFKISFDTDLSDYPIIEFFGGERVEYELNRGRIQEIRFFTRYEQDKKTYTLVERYGKGYVRYELKNKSGDDVSLDYVDELAGLVNIEWDDDIMFAVPFMVYKSPKWEGRGRSIFDLKTDAFDALDETISQWQDAIRLGRIKRYIPESMIPRDPKTGQMMPVNPLDNQFTALSDPMNENGEARIMTEQPAIQYDSYIATYINNLDMCLQGIVSPSTLGIDTKKLDNAEAQREKEKTTLYTRQKIISVLQEILPELVSIAVNSYSILRHEPTAEITCSVDFGEYANPSFEAQVQVIGAAAGSQIMSIESQVETLWGDTKEKSWIEEEVQRIKQEKGIITAEEPSMRPHGFAVEEAMNDGLDRLDHKPSDRDGADDVPKHGPESEAAHGRGGEGRTQVDTMAGAADEEPETPSP